MATIECAICHKTFPADKMFLYGYPKLEKIKVVDHYCWGVPACRKCQEENVARNTRPCVDCGKPTWLPHTQSKRCRPCLTRHQAVSTKVSSQRVRTGQAFSDEAISVEEWKRTVRHFKGKCVYCGAPYTVLDHYFPVRRGGKTTRCNCVPACAHCNGSKNAKLPRDFTDEKTAASIERYLARYKRKQPA